jgi:hypothetical protein
VKRGRREELEPTTTSVIAITASEPHLSSPKPVEGPVQDDRPSAIHSDKITRLRSGERALA